MTRPVAKGWCPGALVPMQSGDGLIVRVRPVAGRLSAAQVLGLCAAARSHGSGIVDLTSRANLQVRGVQAGALDRFQADLAALDLLDGDPETERRRNILTAPVRTSGDLVEDMAHALIGRLADLPDLPAKFGFAIDCGPARQLSAESADIRLERDRQGALMVRADGVQAGRRTGTAGAIEAMLDMARWFAAHRGGARRMRDVAHDLPPGWCLAAPAPDAAALEPGPIPGGIVLGAGFGSVDAAALARLMTGSGADGLIVTPWRMFVLTRPGPLPAHEFIDRPGDPLLRTDACPGAPFCTSATVETRDLARYLATAQGHPVHVSGCAKGCANSKPVARTLVGRDGRFDLVIEGRSWDEPARRGLDPRALMSGTETI